MRTSLANLFGTAFTALGGFFTAIGLVGYADYGQTLIQTVGGLAPSVFLLGAGHYLSNACDCSQPGKG